MTQVSHRTRLALTVRRRFEATRLSPTYLADAYAAVVPVVRRRVGPGRQESRVAAADSAIRAGGDRR
jgi:hypothetical protein